jgi:hypothetical protein
MEGVFAERNQSMRSLKLAVLAAGLSGIAFVRAQADPAAFVGQWHWNKAQSTSIPGEPSPKEIQLNITELSGGKLKWVLNEVDPEGGKHSESFDGRSDGAASAVMGAGAPTTAAFTLTGDTLSAVFKSQDGSGDNWSCMLSPDGKTMSCKGTETDGKGHSAPYTDIYDRG